VDAHFFTRIINELKLATVIAVSAWVVFASGSMVGKLNPENNTIAKIAATVFMMFVF
jgi:hypothetical protein